MVEARRTQFYQVHKQIAKLTDFAGFEMPLYYKGIVPEHLAVRNSVGVFDISHMGRILVTGGDSERFLNYVITNDVSKLLPNTAQYSVMCTEEGGIVDDFVVYRIEPERFLIVFNASNRAKDRDWLVKHVEGFNVGIEDVSDSVAMLAVQGPKAVKVLQEISSEDLSSIERFKCEHVSLTGVRVFLARTGYSGEDGFEVFIWGASLSDPSNALNVWNAILETGRSAGIEPCGLGARDTLRLEAGLCLYGNDIDEYTNPMEAGLGFVVKFQKDHFIGKTSLERQKSEGLKRRRVGFVMLEEGIPRPNFEVYSENGGKIGILTSGTFSPLLKRGIGMGYVDKSQALEGSIVNIGIRGRQVRARISAFPLYDPEKYGYKRKVQI